MPLLTDEKKIRIVASFDDYRGLGLTGVVGIAFVLAGAYVEAVGHTSGSVTFRRLLGAHFLAELGIAFVVGAIVAAVIERRARERAEEAHDQRRQEIEQDIFRHLFGFGLHDSIVHELLETILSSQFMRDEFHIEWQFSHPPADVPAELKHCLCTLTTVSYSLRNTSRDPAPYTITHYFENVLEVPAAHNRFVELSCEAGGLRVHLKDDELSELTTSDGIRRRFQLRPITVAPDDPVRVSFTYRTIRRRDDSEAWITTVPTSGMTLTAALVDASAADLIFQPDTSHRSEPALESSTSASDSRLRRWRIRSGLLPYQGVVMYWRPKAMASGSKPGTAA